MGLAPKFKQYLNEVFPAVATKNEPPPPGGVVVDVMVALHSHTVRAGDDAPATWLAQTLLFAIGEAPLAALCFDVSATTPEAKAIEWESRPKPAVVMTAADVEFALETNQLPDLASLVASRQARTALCRWLVQRVAERLRWGTTLLVLDDGMPTVYRTSASGERSQEARPDMARSLHGEADISCVFAAHALHAHFGAPVVEILTCDTDLVLIGCMNVFEGLRVRLVHFDHASKRPVYLWVDCAVLAREGPARYRVTLPEWAALVASRGTDYVKSMIHGVGDWDVYLHGCAAALNDVKSSRGGKPFVAADRVETGPLHVVFVAASERMKRARCRYERDDGTLARLAWNLLYFHNAVHRGGEGLDCTLFGWQKDGGRIAVRSHPPATFGLGGRDRMV
jgi:hypothetical protein